MPSVVSSEILKAVKTASNVAGKARTPALRSVWLVFNRQNLVIRATDSHVDYAARVTLPAAVDTETIIGVDGKILAGLLAKLQPGEVEFHVLDANKIRLKQGRRQFDLAAMENYWFQPGEAFPENAQSFFISGSALSGIISSVEYCVHQDEDVPPMNCLLLDQDDTGQAVAVAMNGHQMGVRRFEAADILSSIPENGLKIHRRFLADMRTWMDGLEIEAVIHNKRLHMRDAARGEHWSVPANQELYPQWSQLLARAGDGSESVTVHRVPMMDALERLKFFTSEDALSVRMEMDDHAMNLFTTADGKGVGQDYVPIVRRGGLETITFPLADLLKILSHLRADEANFTFAGDQGPCIISSEGGGDEYKVLLMPMLVKDEVYTEEEAA